MDFFDDDATSQAPRRDQPAPPRAPPLQSSPHPPPAHPHPRRDPLRGRLRDGLVGTQLPAEPQSRVLPHLLRGRLGGHQRLRRARQAARPASSPTPPSSRARSSPPSSPSSARSRTRSPCAPTAWSRPTRSTTEQAVFAEGMKVRADGFKLFETTMLGILGKKKVNPAKLAALAGYFSGPDAYYTSRVYIPARNTLSEQGVTDVLVPTSTFYLTTKTFDRATPRADAQQRRQLHQARRHPRRRPRERDRPARRHHAHQGRHHRHPRHDRSVVRRRRPEPGRRHRGERRRHGGAQAARRGRAHSRPPPSPPSPPARRRASPSRGS